VNPPAEEIVSKIAPAALTQLDVDGGAGRLARRRERD
jgi:hypothetical protein